MANRKAWGLIKPSIFYLCLNLITLNKLTRITGALIIPTRQLASISEISKSDEANKHKTSKWPGFICENSKHLTLQETQLRKDYILSTINGGH
ncbi:hypothetical protein J2125_001966 [Erwinia toletana]|uniref:Uncharacterized protein n=1 Tax=Winslowiella toletana TaxID=92490 RepID=A0ABS4P820_9GAMM|nr:hypothetical protein [Winslowiella toletana]